MLRLRQEAQSVLDQGAGRKARTGKSSEMLDQELDRLEQEQKRAKAELTCVGREPLNTVEIPPVQRIRELAGAALKDLAVDTQEFARVVRRLVPRVVVFPFRLCDGGAVVLRAQFRLSLANLLPDRRVGEVLRRPLTKTIEVDLFDPSERQAFRTRVVALRAAGATEDKAAEDCGITVTAAQRAAALQQKMDSLGISDPYLPVAAPPDDCGKLRRHKHPQYRFEPLPGAGEL